MGFIFNSKVVKYILIFCTIYFGRDTLVCSSFIGFLPCYLILGAILAVLLINIFVNYKKNREDVKNKSIHFLIISLLVIISMVINQAYTMMYFTIIFAILFGYILTFYFEYDEFFSILINIMSFLIIYSFIATYLLNGILSVPSIVNASSISFNNFIFCFIPNIENYIRIFSIFREPGIYQFFIILSLYYILFQKDGVISTKYKIKLMILVAGLITTFSVTGYIALAILIIGYIVKVFDSKVFRRYINKVFLFLIVFIILSLTLINFNDSIYWMIYSMCEKVANLGNNDPRVSAIIYNMRLIFNSLFIGNDINLVLSGIKNNTSSILTIYATFGLVLGWIFTYGYGKYLLISFKTLKESIISVLKIGLFFMLLNSQNMITNIYLYLPIILFHYNKKE